MNKKLILENGMVFEGVGFGADTTSIAELVFNTSMVGYQEIMSDSSYNGQMVCMTYPLIGNYGVNDDDYETKTPKMGGFIVKEYNDKPSNFRYTKSLGELMEELNIPGISGIDTRAVTRAIRETGSMKAMITGITEDTNKCLAELKRTDLPTNQVETVSCTKAWHSRTAGRKFNVVAVDCGIKYNIIRKLNEKGCNVTIVPHNASVAEILSYNPDGLFLSNGPGNPEDATNVANIVKELQGRLPIFGICLGHQVIAIANGAKTYKLKFGHRGGNHPVKRLCNGKVEITSQNHSYAVDTDSVKQTKLDITHINVLDNTVEGLESKDDYLFSVQYHPESAPGPQDSDYLFGIFIDNMTAFKEEK